MKTASVLFWSVLLCANLMSVSRCLGAEAPKLPGPGIMAPVDLDGDGRSTFGDVYIFNYWLELGGSRAKAIESSAVQGDVIDLSAFFHGPQAALSADAALLSYPPERTAPVKDADDAVSTAEVQPPKVPDVLRYTGPHKATVYEDGDDRGLLEGAAGHALVGTQLYVARRVVVDGDHDGGIAKITGLDVAGDGAIPIGSSRVVHFRCGLCMASQMAYDKKANDLLVTQSTAGGSKCGGGTPKGRVVRIDLDGQVADCVAVDQGATRGLHDPDGIVVLPRQGECHAQVGDLIISDAREWIDYNTWGALWRVPAIRTGCVDPAEICNNLQDDDQDELIDCEDPDCEDHPDCRDPWWLKSLDASHGLAVGDFKGAGRFGVYFTFRSQSTPPQWGVTRTWPKFVTEARVECSTGWALNDEPHATISTTLPLRIAEFDPYSESLFVTGEDNTIWRIRATPGKDPVVFATGLQGPFGLSFPHSGVLLVSEEGRLSVIDGWRYTFLRGDANADGVADTSDVHRIAHWLFLDGPEPSCWDSADVDDDSAIQVADAIYLLNSLYGGGPAPPAPYPDPGTDPTGDLLGCREYIPAQEISW